MGNSMKTVLKSKKIDRAWNFNQWNKDKIFLIIYMKPSQTDT